MFLDVASLWYLEKEIERRVSSALRRKFPPTWSWAGWIGPIHIQTWKIADDYISKTYS
jgi:hypothetical protein